MKEVKISIVNISNFWYLVDVEKNYLGDPLNLMQKLALCKEVLCLQEIGNYVFDFPFEICSKQYGKFEIQRKDNILLSKSCFKALDESVGVKIEILAEATGNESIGGYVFNQMIQSHYKGQGVINEKQELNNENRTPLDLQESLLNIHTTSQKNLSTWIH